MRTFLKVIAILLVIMPINSWATSEIQLTRSQLAVLAHNLAAAPRSEQSEFARIALTQLYITYESELRRSFDDKSAELKDRRKLGRWRSATSRYLADIERALGHINQGSEYSFFVNQQGRIVFSVSGETLMVSGPNYKAESELESTIVNYFCSLYDCEDYLSESRETFVRFVRPAVHGYWSMSREHKADFSTDAGIIYRFRNLTGRKAKEDWSLELTRELLSIFQTLENIQAKGYTVDYSAVSIASNSAEDGIVTVTINNKGDFINLSLPTLDKSTGIYLELLPWLKRFRFNNIKRHTAIIVLSEQYYAGG